MDQSSLINIVKLSEVLSDAPLNNSSCYLELSLNND